MSELSALIRLLSDGRDWRSDMSQPAPYDSRGQQPEAQSFRARTILDNVPPMASDAMSAMGVSSPVAGDYANRLKGLADSIPPVSLLNLASGIGNEARNGNYGTAAGLAGIGGLMGLYARGLMPGNRDAGMAKMLERFDGPPAISPFNTSSFMKSAPGVNFPQNTNLAVPNRGGVPAANVNNRKEFERPFFVLGE